MPSLSALVTSIRRPSYDTAAADAIPILVDNEYHLFHLTTPPSTVHHPERLRSSWSHLRSTSLSQWKRDEKFALTPGKTPDTPDADGIWTGSAIIGPDGNMHIIYTGYNLSQNGKQVIIHATSQDRGGTIFAKSAEPIKIVSEAANRAAFEEIDFRDPYVLYNEDEKCYWMLVGTRLAQGPHWTRGCLALLTSPDLKAWSLEPQPFYAPNDMMCPECPELFSLNGRWYLVYSRFSAPNAGTVYRVADSPRGPFRAPRDGSGGRLDGRRWYAAKSCPKADDATKRIYFGWIADQATDGKWCWGGDMALPREVTAKEDGSLIIGPVRSVIKDVFSAFPSFSTSTIELNGVGRTDTQFLDKVKCERPYMISFNIQSASAASFGLMFDVDINLKGLYLRFVSTFAGRYTVSLTLAPAPLDDFWSDQYQLYLSRGVDGPEIVRHENVSIEGSVAILRSGDTIEVFVGGRALSYRLLGTAAATKEDDGKTWDIGVFVEDGTLEYSNFKITEGMDY